MGVDHTTLLRAVMYTGLSTAIRESSWAVMAFEAVHLIGLALVGGPAIIIGLASLRRDGLRGLSVATLTEALLPVLWVGLLLLAVSGALITVSMPFKYYNNPAFRCKMVLLALALVTTVALRSTRQRGVAVCALVLWFTVGFSGRLIGFL